MQPGRTGRTRETATVAGLCEAARGVDDTERLAGLIGAPLAALIAMMVVSALVVNDPAPRLRSGALDPVHVSVSLYVALGAVLVLLSLVMLGMAIWHKRLGMAIPMVLYGLGLFNLRYWGFGVPYLLAGSWLLVRAYQYQKDLRALAAG